MSGEHDRVARVSDLRELEARLEARLEKFISKEAGDTRRHFDVVAERLESHLKLVAEVNAHHASILDNHESRLQKIEQDR